MHAYLMYGFPGETTEKTIESLNGLGNLFAPGLFQSAFHKFTATLTPRSASPRSNTALVLPDPRSKDSRRTI